MSASQVTAGGVVVKVLADNQELEKGLRASAQRLAGFAAAARAVLGTGVASGGAAISAGLAGATVAGRAVANTMGNAGKAIRMAFGGGEIAQVTKALDRMTPVSARVWDVTQSGIGRGTRLLSTLRQGLAAAGVSALPLLSVFDRLSMKSAGIVTGAKWSALFKGDFASAGMFSSFQKPAREAWLQDRWRRGGATGVVGASVGRLFNPIELFEGMSRFSINPLKTTGAALRTVGDIGLGGIGGRLNIATKSLAGAGIAGIGGLVGKLASTGGTAAKALATMSVESVKSAAGIDKLSRSVGVSERGLSRFLPKLSGVGAAIRSLAFRGGVLGGGILGTLTAAAGISAGIGDLFSARGFTKHAAEMGDEADQHKTSVGVYSNYSAAAQLAGISLDDALKDKNKLAKVEAQRSRAASLGGYITPAQLALAREANQATAEMGIAFRSVGTALGSAVLPQIIAGVSWTTNLASTIAKFIQQNPALIQQLFSIGKGFVIGASAAAAIATAVGFVASPMGAAAVAVGTLAAAFPTLWSMAAPYLGNITSGLTDLQAGFDLVFGGIMDALSAGNLGLAAEVAWAGLLVAWETGIATADQKWREWSTAIADVFDEALTGARIVLDEWFPGIEDTFATVFDWIRDAWTITVNAFLSQFDRYVQAIKVALNVVRTLWDRTFDLKGANDAIYQQTERKLEARQEAQDTLLSQRQAARQKRNSEIAANGGLAATLAKEQRERKEQRATGLATKTVSSQQLEDAKARLAAALKAAAAARKAKEDQQASKVTEGSLKVKEDIKERQTRGAAANDIRTREGLQDLLIAFRGRGTASLDTLANQSTQQITAIKQGNEIHEKNRDLLDQINRKPGSDKPIGR